MVEKQCEVCHILLGAMLCRHLDHALANRSLGRQALKNDHIFPTNGEADMRTNINPAWPNSFFDNLLPPISLLVLFESPLVCNCMERSSLCTSSLLNWCTVSQIFSQIQGEAQRNPEPCLVWKAVQFQGVSTSQTVWSSPSGTKEHRTDRERFA